MDHVCGNKRLLMDFRDLNTMFLNINLEGSTEKQVIAS